MLKDFVKPAEPGEEELKKELKEAQEKETGVLSDGDQKR